MDLAFLASEPPLQPPYFARDRPAYGGHEELYHAWNPATYTQNPIGDATTAPIDHLRQEYAHAMVGPIGHHRYEHAYSATPGNGTPAGGTYILRGIPRSHTIYAAQGTRNGGTGDERAAS